jgi:hypothetical protein
VNWAAISIAIGLGAVLAAIHPALLILAAAAAGWLLLRQ